MNPFMCNICEKETNSLKLIQFAMYHGNPVKIYNLECRDCGQTYVYVLDKAEEISRDID